MNCRELHGFLDDYLCGSLPADVHEGFETHLAECPPCRSYLDTYRRTIALTRDARGSDGPPAEMPEELVRAIMRVRPRRPHGGGEGGR